MGNDDVFRTGFFLFDEMMGFLPGRVHLVVGRCDLGFHLLDRLVSLSAFSGRDVRYIDGAHRANPFSMASVLRSRRVDPYGPLNRVRIARAFTAHQMDSLIRTRLDGGDLILVTAMDSLFSDPQVPDDEGKGMLDNCMEVLEEKAKGGSCVVIAAMGAGRGGELVQRMRSRVSGWVTLHDRPGNRVRVVVQGGGWRDLRMVDPFQYLLEDFAAEAA